MWVQSAPLCNVGAPQGDRMCRDLSKLSPHHWPLWGNMGGGGPHQGIVDQAPPPPENALGMCGNIGRCTNLEGD